MQKLLHLKMQSQFQWVKKSMFFLKDSEQLQSNRYGQNDDTQVSNVAVGTIHPLSWIWNITDNKMKLNSHK